MQVPRHWEAEMMARDYLEELSSAGDERGEWEIDMIYDSYDSEWA